MNYFSNCNTIEDAREIHRKLVKSHHPDLGGDVETMQIINNQFDEFCKVFTNSAFQKFTGSKSNSDIAEKIGKILRKMEGWDVKIEIIGSWIYAFNSFTYKNELKDLGFWYSGKHKAWVYSGSPKNRKRRTKYNLNSIRSYHGSQSVNLNTIAQIE